MVIFCIDILALIYDPIPTSPSLLTWSTPPGEPIVLISSAHENPSKCREHLQITLTYLKMQLGLGLLTPKGH